MGLTKTQVAAGMALIAMLAIPQHVEAETNAWHFDIQSTLLLAPLDPIIAPNKLASHVHRIWGGNNFAAGYSYAESQKATCSSIYVQQDKSNYWTPQLYVTTNPATSPTNTYEVVPSDHRFYYFLDRSFADVPVAPFPEGLRMLVGNLSAKSYKDTGLPDKALTFTCQDPMKPNENVIQDNFNFPKACVELKTELKFPSCWDAKNLWLDDMSHMAYPQKTLYGPCPYSHPIRLPAIMLENTWKIQRTKLSGSVFNGRMIWANGDTTGYGFHADFTSGWDTAFLKKALEDPACLPGKSIPAKECPSLNINEAIDGPKAKACKPLRGYVNETGTRDNDIVTRLPGCNLPWSSGAKPKCTDTPAVPQINSFLGVTPGPNAVPVDRNAKPAAATNTWSKIGCMDSYVLDLGNKTLWQNWKNMTNANCQDFCSQIGKPYAATTLGYQCMCGKNMNTASYHLDDSMCSKPCTGTDTGNCGADGAYNTWYNPAVAAAGPKQPSATDKSYLGCHVSGTIKGITGTSNKVDVDTCRAFCKGYKYFDLSNSRYCSCGNDFNNPNALQSRVAEFNCQAKCTGGNTNQICGGNVDGTFYDSVYLVDGTWSATPAVGSATTVSSVVPKGTGVAAAKLAAFGVITGGGAKPTASALPTSAETALSSADSYDYVQPSASPAVDDYANEGAYEEPAAAPTAVATDSTSTSAQAEASAVPVVADDYGYAAPSLDSPTKARPADASGRPVSMESASASAALESGAHSHHGHHMKCQIVTKTVTVTREASATGLHQRHALRRSRHHAFN